MKTFWIGLAATVAAGLLTLAPSPCPGHEAGTAGGPSPAELAAPDTQRLAIERARAEGLVVRFDQGDAEELPYADASFDVAVTPIGAMFAPRPERVAAEFARVIRPGGKLHMANWTPYGMPAMMFKCVAA